MALVGPSHPVPTLLTSAQFYQYRKHLLAKNMQPQFELRCYTGKQICKKPKELSYAHRIKLR